jgi:alpha-D-xyloside xylohydrolase
VPWAYDEEAVDVLRFFTRLKASLMPYLYAAAEEAHADGVPMMRSMVMEFPEDRTCAYLDRQYMLGSSLLTAPVMNEEGIAEYYLPEGIWTNYFTGEEREGGKWFREKLGYCELPLWVKQDSVISEGAHDDGPEYDYAENVTLKIYRPADGTKKSIIITGPDGSEEERFEIERKASLISIDAKGGHPYQVKLMNSRNAGIAGDSKASKVSKVSDAVKAVSQKDGTLFTGCRGKIKLTVGAGKNEQRIQ